MTDGSLCYIFHFVCALESFFVDYLQKVKLWGKSGAPEKQSSCAVCSEVIVCCIRHVPALTSPLGNIRVCEAGPKHDS